MTLPSRRVLLAIAGALLFGAVLVGLPWLSAERGVRRSWDKVVDALERNDRADLTAYLAEDYKDGFGLDRGGAIQIATTFRGHFALCLIRREDPRLTLSTDKRAAITRAVIRLDGQGSPVAQAAIQASRTTNTSTEFRWRRASWKPWDWRLVSVDNADAARAISRFEREAASAGLTP